MNRKALSLFLVAIIVTTSYGLFTQHKLPSDQTERNAIRSRGISNTIGTAISIDSIHEDVFVAGQTHQWLKEASPNSRFTVNLSMEAISIYTLTVYTNAASCGTSTGYYSYNASLTCTPAASGGDIYLLIQVSIPVDGDEIDYNLATTLDPIWVNPPEEYTDHDLGSDSQLNTPVVISTGQSISGFFSSTWDTDYIKINTLPGIFRFNLSFSNISSGVGTSDWGFNDCRYGTIPDNSSSSGYLTWVNCLVFSTENYISFAGSNNGGDPLQWQVWASSVQILPIEDASKGDADSPGELLSTGDSIEGTMGSDGGQPARDISDYFRIKIDHGKSVALRVWIEEGVKIQSVNSVCLDQSDPITNVDLNQHLILTPEVETTIHCITENNYDWLTIIFHNDKQYLPPPEDRVNYSFTVVTGSLFDAAQNTDTDGGSDAPPEAPGIMLSTGEHQGEFRHRSDTIDVYRTIIPPGKGRIIASYGDSISLEGAVTEGEFLSTMSIENPSLDELEESIVVRRSHPLVGNHPSFATQNESYRLSISEYNLSTTLLPIIPEFLTISSTYQIEPWGENELSAWKYAPSLSSVINLPIQWDPTKTLQVTANQASGQEVILRGVAWNLNSDNREGTILLKKQLEPSRDNVEWYAIILMGLDGSKLTITTSEGHISSLTDDGDVLNSIAIGTLGISSDEGFDREDEWKVEMNSGYRSVLISDLIGIEGSLDTGGLSDTFCFDPWGPGATPGLPYNQTVKMMHHSGDGTYTLQVASSADDAVCPDAQIFNVGNHQSSTTFNANPGMEMWAEVRGSFEGDIAPLVKLELRSPDSTLLWTSPSNTTMNSFIDVPIPDDASPGRLHLLAYLEGVIVDESFVEVAYTSSTVSIGNVVLRPGQNPWLMVEARSYGEGQPLIWNLSDINIWQRDSNGFPKTLSSPSNISGSGSEVVQLELDVEPQPGGYLWVEGTLQSGETTSSFIDMVEVDPLDLMLSCARHNKTTTEEWINMLLCTISAHGDTIGNFQGLSGKVSVLSTQNLVILEEDFSTDEYGNDYLNFDLTDFPVGEWYVVIKPDAVWNSWVDHRDMYYFSNGYSPSQQDGDGLNSDFKLSISTERESLLGGDELVVYWEMQGQTASALHWWISNQYGSVMSAEIDVGTQRSGTLRIDLPVNITISSNHQFYIRAHSIHGATDTASVFISGLAANSELALDISPDMPIPGESIQVELSVNSDSDWLDWDWVLKTGSSSNTIIAEGNGWNMDDHGSFSVEIPRANYPNGLIFTISATDEARNFYSQSMNINLRSLVELRVESPEYAVIGKSFRVDWSVESYAPSSVDKASIIEVSIIQLGTSEEIQVRELLASGESGFFRLTIDNHVKPGTYIVYLILKTTGGSEYEYTTLIEIQSPSEPVGINLLGINIPPLGDGFDTILTILLLANIIAVWIIFYRQKKSENEEQEELEDESTISEMIDLDYQQLTPSVPISTLDGYEHHQQSFPKPSAHLTANNGIDNGFEWLNYEGKNYYRAQGSMSEWAEFQR